ncbi:MAG TPA: DUF4974 domain-containing protein [Flavitalea sp.]|nr:DUF4974 domain-containing protein [Flavitalea sp.]
MTNRNTWQYLVDQYLSNSISKEELEVLLQRAASEEDRDALVPALQAYWQEAKKKAGDNQEEWDRKFEEMMREVKKADPIVERNRTINWRPLYRSIVAAIIIALIGAGGYRLLFNGNNQEEKIAQQPALQQGNDLAPGSNGAILTLADGRQVILDSAGNGTLALQGKTKVTRQDGQIIYDTENNAQQQVLFNAMSTPRGRQYQLVLSDGTKVWLNASSSIRYPAAFTDTERKVEITGEAYFEVSQLVDKEKGRKIPFIVKIVSGEGRERGEVQVLGTHFNVNSYEDETIVKTTLLEGSVKIMKDNRSRILLPGQQAQFDNRVSEDIQVAGNVDLEAVMAWKNGYFSFVNTDLAAIFRQISRWYDVDVEYRGKIPDRRFGGEVSRNTNVSEVLKILEKSKVYCTVEGRKIIVMPED